VKYKVIFTLGLVPNNVFEPHGFDPNRPYEKEKEYFAN
jgi:hypothetical protein